MIETYAAYYYSPYYDLWGKRWFSSLEAAISFCRNLNVKFHIDRKSDGVVIAQSYSADAHQRGGGK